MVQYNSRADKAFCAVNYIFLSLILLAVVYPIWFVLVASVSDPTYVNLGQTILLPKGFNLEGYKKILDYPEVLTGYANTAKYTLVGTSINLAVLLPAAYALSRRELVGRRFLTVVFVFTMYFSGGVVPLYLQVRSLHLMNTMWALVLPTALSVYNMVICRSFFAENVPEALFESARLDGAGYTRFFFSVALPLSKAIVAVMVLFHALIHWNSYLNALYYIRDRAKYPLQLVLRGLTAQLDVSQAESIDSKTAAEASRLRESVKYAIIIVSSLPVLVLYPFVQKYFIKGWRCSMLQNTLLLRKN